MDMWLFSESKLRTKFDTIKESDIFTELIDERILEIGSIIEFYYVGAYSVNEIPNFIIKKPKVYYLGNY